MSTRRDFTRGTLLAALTPLLAAAPASAAGPFGPQPRKPLIKVGRIRKGDTIGLMIPSFANWDPVDLDVLLETLDALGLKAKLGKHVNDRYGYLAGRDEDRAADFNMLIADSSVRAIHCVRGGWGAARMLPFLDFDAVAKNPKPIIGFSDITALLLAVHARTGLVTFHGPSGSSEWNATNIGWMQRVMWNAETPTFENPKDLNGLLVPTKNRTSTITPGKATGRLLGGNLTVLTTILGSPYVPDFKGAILFIEDVEEAPYSVDRMITQLKLNGILKDLAGFVWGTCARCEPSAGYGSLTIPDILNDHIKPLGIPAYSGAMFGHINAQFTLPLGVEVELDATRGTIRMLEAAVV